MGYAYHRVTTIKIPNAIIKISESGRLPESETFFKDSFAIDSFAIFEYRNSWSWRGGERNEGAKRSVVAVLP